MADFPADYLDLANKKVAYASLATLMLSLAITSPPSYRPSTN